MGAMGEGFGDYLAMSFYFADGDAAYQAANNPCVGEWDATSYASGNPPCLRRTDGNKMYPGDLTGSVHADGEIWSRALWDIRAALGGPTTDQIVLEHHFSLPADASMTVAALEMIAADGALNAGVNDSALRLAFCDRGILSGTECLPAMAAPTITFPAGGETLSPGAAVDITWDRNGATQDAEYAVSYSDQCSTINTVFTDDMESGAGNWTTGGTGSTWALGADTPYSGSFAWNATDPASLSDQYLALATPVLVAPNAVLSVWHNFNTESGFDGGVIEISSGGGPWTDVESAITQNGYAGSISTCCSSPIGGQNAFTGISGGYIETLVDLSTWVGQSCAISLPHGDRLDRRRRWLARRRHQHHRLGARYTDRRQRPRRQQPTLDRADISRRRLLHQDPGSCRGLRRSSTRDRWSLHRRQRRIGRDLCQRLRGR